MRTSKVSILLRATAIVFMIYMAMAWSWNSITGTNFWKPFEMAVAAVLTVMLHGGFAWLFTNLGMTALYGRDSEYQRFQNRGGDPFFDSLPPPLNTDSEITRFTGLQEPSYTDFIPPRHWRFQCPRCGARVEHRIDVCWNCRYGEDGDSTDYYRRWGNG